MRGRRVRLLTVAGAGATADVVVAADVPVGQLCPALAKLVGGWELPPDDPRWVLLTAGGTDPSASTPAPVDRRFGAASRGHPDPSPRPPTGMEASGRRPGLARMIVSAVALLVVGSFLLGRWSADRGEVAVWQATRPIPAGKAVTEADLRQGEALVGIALAAGAAPAEGLAAGDVVRVIRLPVTAEDVRESGGGRLVLAAAPVWPARTGKDGATVVTLRVAVEDADHIAGLNARGAVALERVAAPR